MMMQKKWAQGVILTVTAFGLIVSWLVNYKELFYLVLLIAGAVLGRAVYLAQQGKLSKNKKSFFPLVYLIIILAVLFNSLFSKTISLFILVTAALLSYYLHLKKLAGSFKSSDYIK